jgi:hypothetical protein
MPGDYDAIDAQLDFMSSPDLETTYRYLRWVSDPENRAAASRVENAVARLVRVVDQLDAGYAPLDRDLARRVISAVLEPSTEARLSGAPEVQLPFSRAIDFSSINRISREPLPLEVYRQLSRVLGQMATCLMTEFAAVRAAIVVARRDAPILSVYATPELGGDGRVTGARMMSGLRQALRRANGEEDPLEVGSEGAKERPSDSSSDSAGGASVNENSKLLILRVFVPGSNPHRAPLSIAPVRIVPPSLWAKSMQCVYWGRACARSRSLTAGIVHAGLPGEVRAARHLHRSPHRVGSTYGHQ